MKTNRSKRSNLPVLATVFDSQTRVFLTLRNIDSGENIAYYVFVPLLGLIADVDILSQVIRVVSHIQTPLKTLQMPFDAFRRGGLWLELLAPPTCSYEEVMVRLLEGLEELQNMLAEEGGKLALVETPFYETEDGSQQAQGLPQAILMERYDW